MDPNIFITLYSVYTLLVFITMIPLVRQNKVEYNPFNNAFKNVLIFTWVLNTIGYLFDHIEQFAFNQPIVLGAGLRVSYITGFAVQAVLLWFFLYVKDWKIHYPLPVIWLLFIALALYEFNSSIPTIISSASISIVSIVFFLRKGVKNMNGVLFAYGIFMLTFTLVDFMIYQPSSTMDEGYHLMGPIIGLVALNFGTWGWLDTHVFYDRAKEAAIRNTWISKMVLTQTKGKNKQQGSRKPVTIHTYRPKTIKVECPHCHATNHHVFTPEAVAAHSNSQKAIQRVIIDPNEICEHAFTIYVDRNLDVRGYGVAG